MPIVRTLAIIVAIVVTLLWFARYEENQHRQQVHQAWQIISVADGKSGSGGRKEALKFLNTPQPWFGIGLFPKYEKQSLSGLSAPNAYLVSAELKGADLEEANLQGANLYEADLQGANLLFANLQGTNLWFANLQGADLREANLQGARLWFANLQGANLVGANLKGADLEGAKLQGVKYNSQIYRDPISGVEYQPTIFPDKLEEEEKRWGMVDVSAATSNP